MHNSPTNKSGDNLSFNPHSLHLVDGNLLLEYLTIPQQRLHGPQMVPFVAGSIVVLLANHQAQVISHINGGTSGPAAGNR